MIKTGSQESSNEGARTSFPQVESHVFFVMAGLDPAIHVDHRGKPGDDGFRDDVA
jgi:hypothetical protein